MKETALTASSVLRANCLHMFFRSHTCDRVCEKCVLICAYTCVYVRAAYGWHNALCA